MNSQLNRQQTNPFKW